MNERGEQEPPLELAERAREVVNAERISAVQEVLQEATQLVTGLNNDRPSDFAEHSLFFDTASVQGLYLPEAVQDALLTRRLSQIEVYVQDSRADPGNTRLQLIYHLQDNVSNGDDDMRIVLPMAEGQDGQAISRGIFTEDSDVEKPMPVEYQDMRQSLASLFIPSMLGDYEQFREVDMLDEGVYEPFVASLRKKANASITEATYFLYDEEGATTGWVEYGTTDTELRFAEITNILSAVSEVSSQGEIIDEQQAIAAQIVFEKGSLGIDFYQTKGPVGIPGASEQFDPELSDIRILREFISEQSGRILGPQFVSFEEIQEPIFDDKKTEDL